MIKRSLDVPIHSWGREMNGRGGSWHRDLWSNHEQQHLVSTARPPTDRLTRPSTTKTAPRPPKSPASQGSSKQTASNTCTRVLLGFNSSPPQYRQGSDFFTSDKSSKVPSLQPEQDLDLPPTYSQVGPWPPFPRPPHTAYPRRMGAARRVLG